jgi:repressor LexA
LRNHDIIFSHIRYGAKSMDIAERIKKRRIELGITVDEIAEALNVNRATVYRYESKDIEKMPLTVLEPLAEVLRVTPYYLMGWTDDAMDHSHYDILPVTRHKIPVIGNVHCGDPVYAEEDYLDLVDSDISADFALRVKGDSMTGAGITEGDLVFVRQQSAVENGELAVVLIGDEAAVKRVYKYDTYISLNADNPAYAPIIFREGDGQEVSILGKVVAYTHYYKR